MTHNNTVNAFDKEGVVYYDYVFQVAVHNHYLWASLVPQDIFYGKLIAQWSQ